MCLKMYYFIAFTVKLYLWVFLKNMHLNVVLLKHAKIGWWYFAIEVWSSCPFMEPELVLHIFSSGNLAQQMLYREYSTEISGHKRAPKIETLQLWCLHKICVRDRYRWRWWKWKVSEQERDKEVLENKIRVGVRSHKDISNIKPKLKSSSFWFVRTANAYLYYYAFFFHNCYHSYIHQKVWDH